MKRQCLTTAGLLLAMMSATTVLAAAPTTPSPVPHTIVLPVSEGPGLMYGASRFWTPHTADLRRLEHDLPPSLADYYRQYIGIVQDGKRLILINGFSADVAPEFTGGKDDWHHHAVFVNDGGNAFFKATYDPRTRRFVGPDFNGQG